MGYITMFQSGRNPIPRLWVNSAAAKLLIEGAAGTASTGSRKRSRNMKTKTILLVDDDPTVGEAIAIALAEKEVKFYFALDLKAAMLILDDHAHELDLVVTEVEPHGHALALLKALKAYPGIRLPMIVLGSITDLEANAKALRACKVMRMPLDFMQLWTSVASIDGTEPVFHPQESSTTQSLQTAA